VSFPERDDQQAFASRDQRAVFVCSARAVIAQLVHIRADCLAGEPCRIDTGEYRCSDADGIDRLKRDIRAGRVMRFSIDERRWGARSIVVNQYAR
jgi:hypothetical protein